MLHAFYSPTDWDSCLAAWATRHALGDAVELHDGPLTFDTEMLLLNRPWLPDYHGNQVEILAIASSTQDLAFTVCPNITLANIHKYQPCCLSTWQNFHVSDPPTFIAEADSKYLKNLDEWPAFNALLSVPWTMVRLDAFIAAYEDPVKRTNLLADGHAILAYRKLRGDLNQESPT